MDAKAIQAIPCKVGVEILWTIQQTLLNHKPLICARSQDSSDNATSHDLPIQGYNKLDVQHIEFPLLGILEVSL